MELDLLDVALALLEQLLAFGLVHGVDVDLLIPLLRPAGQTAEVVALLVPGDLVDVVVLAVDLDSDSLLVLRRGLSVECPVQVVVLFIFLLDCLRVKGILDTVGQNKVDLRPHCQENQSIFVPVYAPATVFKLDLGLYPAGGCFENDK